MEKTIAAISTAMSASGIGIVRISGDEAMDVISRIYRSKNGKKNIREVQSHTIHYGFIYDGEDVVDEVLVMIMRGPHTYTGEDTVEIDCHGGVYAMKKVLETVLKNGAVIAEPGEFTKRAFLNGRLDLSQAEAVMDVIQAKNSMALKSSVEQLKGSVQRAVKEIRSRLLYQIAYIESALDDPEHYDLTGYPQELRVIVDKETKEIQDSVIAVAAAIVIWFILYRTSMGYRIRVMGFNQDAAAMSGINPKTQCMLAFFISGAVAGLAGFTEINGMQHMLLTGLESDIGSYGIGIAIMANANPIGVIFAALLFGTLQVGGTALGHSTDAPASVIDVMLGFVMLFVLMSFFVRKKLEVRSMKKQKIQKGEV